MDEEELLEWVREQDAMLAELERLLLLMRGAAEEAASPWTTAARRRELQQDVDAWNREAAVLYGKLYPPGH
ncbi:hypothetical protein C6I21_08910 [Alkalicoccus urumqiensis]|uniref:Uncharacterized protein n=1 Tax=Alkalicoccus urumqiensis TaxID=1548213 RepID=A0A2P6MH86_ALKUR|nr:hypothetical protein C6I21_08910 [Alkalicoccus urumqiensis]